MTICRNCKSRVRFGRCPTCSHYNDPVVTAPRTNTPPSPSVIAAIRSRRGAPSC